MTFMAKGLMMILLLLAGAACGLAQSCIPLEVQPFDYTLDVHGTHYAGTAVVSPVPGEPVYELTAEGYTGVREDAERIYALLGHAGEAMEENTSTGSTPIRTSLAQKTCIFRLRACAMGRIWRSWISSPGRARGYPGSMIHIQTYIADISSPGGKSP